MVSNTYLKPAYAYIGQPEDIKQQALQFIKKVLCPDTKSTGACCVCITCKQIDARQHHALRWLVPENTYTIAHIEPIFDTIAFALEPGSHFFFVLERADALSITCANSLLKSLEEPPEGYHFILLAGAKDSLLPTISSRCVFYYFEQEYVPHEHPIVAYFTHFNHAKAQEFIKELERLKIAERDVSALLDSICQKLLATLQEAIKIQDQDQIQMLSHQREVLEQARAQLPMPGSSKLFFKNLYLQFLACKSLLR